MDILAALRQEEAKFEKQVNASGVTQNRPYRVT